MLFRQLFDPVSSTYTYLLGDEVTHEAVVIDPVYEQFLRDSALIRELGLKLRYTLDTHCHADHVTAAYLMKENLGSQIVLSARYGAKNVDVAVEHGDVIRFGNQRLQVRATPGHTSGCVTYVTADHRLAFTGDALLIRGTGRTDFQEGDASLLYRSIKEQIFTLPEDCLIYPAHDYQGRTASSVGEERRFNPRIGDNATLEDFVGYMQNMALAHPRQIDVALPANLRSGKPEEEPKLPKDSWAPLWVSFSGVYELAPEWLLQHLGEVHVLDVRAADELSGELGRIDGAQHIPIDELRRRINEVPREKPIVTMCRSGRRSALAWSILSSAGYDRVANLRGGMLALRDAGH